MYEKFRTQRSRPRRLNGVAPKKRIGVSLVRKKCRTSEMFFSRRRGCAEPEAKDASVPTLTSSGLARAVVFAGVAAVVRFAGVDLPVVDFLAGAFFVAFEAVLVRTGRSLMTRTSLSLDSQTLGGRAAEWRRLVRRTPRRYRRSSHTVVSFRIGSRSVAARLGLDPCAPHRTAG